MPKVFLFAIPKQKGKVTGYAIAENGKFLKKIASKNLERNKADLGYGERAHTGMISLYMREFPEGYELEFIPDIRERDDVIAAIKKDPILREKMEVQDWMNIPFPNQKEGFKGYGPHVYRNMRKEE